MNLTKDFTLEEMTRSEAATRHGFKEQFTPNDEIKANLKALCENILQPLREKLGVKIRVTSGYRSKRTNNAIGGSESSQHVLGQAADINVNGISTLELCRKIKEFELPFDQLIEEFGQWVHVSYSPRNRRQVLQATKKGRATKYAPLEL